MERTNCNPTNEIYNALSRSDLSMYRMLETKSWKSTFWLEIPGLDIEVIGIKQRYVVLYLQEARRWQEVNMGIVYKHTQCFKKGFSVIYIIFENQHHRDSLYNYNFKDCM